MTDQTETYLFGAGGFLYGSGLVVLTYNPTATGTYWAWNGTSGATSITNTLRTEITNAGMTLVETGMTAPAIQNPALINNGIAGLGNNATVETANSIRAAYGIRVSNIQMELNGLGQSYLNTYTYANGNTANLDLTYRTWSPWSGSTMHFDEVKARNYLSGSSPNIRQVQQYGRAISEVQAASANMRTLGTGLRYGGLVFGGVGAAYDIYSMGKMIYGQVNAGNTAGAWLTGAQFGGRWGGMYGGAAFGLVVGGPFGAAVFGAAGAVGGEGAVNAANAIISGNYTISYAGPLDRTPPPMNQTPSGVVPSQNTSTPMILSNQPDGSESLLNIDKLLGNAALGLCGSTDNLTFTPTAIPINLGPTYDPDTGEEVINIFPPGRYLYTFPASDGNTYALPIGTVPPPGWTPGGGDQGPPNSSPRSGSLDTTDTVNIAALQTLIGGDFSPANTDTASLPYANDASQGALQNYVSGTTIGYVTATTGDYGNLPTGAALYTIGAPPAANAASSDTVASGANGNVPVGVLAPPPEPGAVFTTSYYNDLNASVASNNYGAGGLSSLLGAPGTGTDTAELTVEGSAARIFVTVGANTLINAGSQILNGLGNALNAIVSGFGGGGTPVGGGGTPVGGGGGGGDGGGGGSGSPVVLDLSGKGINITPLSNSNMFFDMANDGYAQHTAWAGAGNGVLVYDPSGGPVTQANQVNFTLWDPGAKTDMQALEQKLDTNHDGKLDGSELDNFRILYTNPDGTTTLELPPNVSWLSRKPQPGVHGDLRLAA